MLPEFKPMAKEVKYMSKIYIGVVIAGNAVMTMHKTANGATVTQIGPETNKRTQSPEQHRPVVFATVRSMKQAVNNCVQSRRPLIVSES
jgi:hypothetical protein